MIFDFKIVMHVEVDEVGPIVFLDMFFSWKYHHLMTMVLYIRIIYIDLMWSHTLRHWLNRWRHEENHCMDILILHKFTFLHQVNKLKYLLNRRTSKKITTRFSLRNFLEHLQLSSSLPTLGERTPCVNRTSQSCDDRILLLLQDWVPSLQSEW